MRSCVFLALLVMFALAGASLYLYQRIPHLLELQNPASREQAMATVTHVKTPTVKKGQSVSDIQTTVNFVFTVPMRDAAIHGSYQTRDANAAPKEGDKITVHYLRNRPQMFAREEELPQLANQLRWSQWGMVLFGILAVVLPFVILGFGRK